MTEAGYSGRNRGGGIFKASRMDYWLQREDGLDFPDSWVITISRYWSEISILFCGDEAFPLQRYLMRPYAKRSLNNRTGVFNYRLTMSRARKTVEYYDPNIPGFAECNSV